MKNFLFVLGFLTVAQLSVAQESVDSYLKHFQNLKPRSIGPAGMSGRVTSIDVVRTKPEVIYVGTASGGLWRSNSGGIKWEPLFDEQPLQSIGAVAIQQSNPDVVWAGTGEGNPRNSQTSGAGIYKTINGGKTWKLMGLANTKTIHRIIVHPQNPDIVFVGALGSAWGDNSERGVYKTTDGGATWKKVLYANEKTGCADLVIDPENPNKLVAAMWEYQREPWFFNSGGDGSGLYITYDGGETWKRRADKHGLPKGPLGRMGLAIAPSNPKKIYALVESKKKYALYESNDGGFNFKMVSDKNVGNRPFYYADIYVDPKNENRIFNLWSYVSLSQDGGKTFKTILDYGKGVHPDHHAFYIHPDNPNFMMDGNDGGLNISHDGGKNWRFVENLPLGQFYHINVDNEVPYNVYGGMQDNGSWVGPSYVWASGGIRNAHWQELLFGDGFDVVPSPENSRYGYATYQGGSVYRYDRETGKNWPVRPSNSVGTDQLRFNWNAAFTQDPNNACGLYLGSQFVHYSSDCGQTWDIISPDLTTNDENKQKQAISGGLTIDATQAENHTTILCIAPNSKNENVLWVGTDDGRLHVSQSKGKEWKDVYSKLPGAPKGGWVPQIETSPFDESTAFVVVNNYRQNDWASYLYKTTDGGKKWTRLVDNKDVDGYCLSIVQDPVEPNLLFLGTENGLYISFDAGKQWKKWTNGYPSVSTMDMKIQPREHDLVLGTFGRAAFVLDDIRPLRQLAAKASLLNEKPLHVFEIPDAYLAARKQASGVRFTADAHFKGSNRKNGAMISFWADPSIMASPKDKAYMSLTNSDGDTIRSYGISVDTGFNRVFWNMKMDGVRGPSHKAQKKKSKPSGFTVSPGKYAFHVLYNGVYATEDFEVKPDPRMVYNVDDYNKRLSLYRDHEKVVKSTARVVRQLHETINDIALINNLLEVETDSVHKTLEADSKRIVDSLKQFLDVVLLPEDFVGYDHVTMRLGARLGRTAEYISGSNGAPSQMAAESYELEKRELERLLKEVNQYYEAVVLPFTDSVNELRLTPFKEFKPLILEE